MKRFCLVLTVLMSIVMPVADIQAKGYRSTDLPLPRFVSLRADKVYARTGPGRNYPIRWVYESHDMPVEIIQEYDAWRKVRDINGDEGWIHKSLLSGKRTAYIRADEGLADIYDRAGGGRVIARAETGVIAVIGKCDLIWCKVSAKEYTGWIERKFLWGIYGGENLN